MELAKKYKSSFSPQKSTKIQMKSSYPCDFNYNFKKNIYNLYMYN